MKNNIIFHLVVCFFLLYQTNGLPLLKNTPKKATNPEERPNLFEGDMRIPQSNARGVLRRGSSVAWPNGVVPYEIAPGYALEQEQLIRSTMQRMENALAVNNVLCIDFRPRTSSDKYYITIRNTQDGCSSNVGQNPTMSGERTVSLEHPGCTSTGIIMHELLHTLGFHHEQSRPDRDNYITVYQQNMRPNTENNFQKYDNTNVNTLNTPYDYESVMHYSSDAFAIDNTQTIVPKDPNAQIGQRIFMSPIDIAEVRMAYNCSASGTTIPIVPTPKKTSNYSSSLTTNDKMYMPPGETTSDRYYKAIQIVVDRSGIYYIQSVSNMDTLGYLYENSFNPTDPSLNLYENNDDGGGNNHYCSIYFGCFYTFPSRLTGSFSIMATGPGNVQYSQFDSSVTTIPPTTTRPAIIDSTYSSSLTSMSPTFCRDGTAGSVYYYDPIAVGVKTSGTYTFKSSGSLDAYGSLYETKFDSSAPTTNRISYDDDGAGSGQFQLTSTLNANTKYILVYTTYGQRKTGQFNIIASGPDTLSLV